MCKLCVCVYHHLVSFNLNFQQQCSILEPAYFSIYICRNDYVQCSLYSLLMILNQFVFIGFDGWSQCELFSCSLFLDSILINYNYDGQTNDNSYSIEFTYNNVHCLWFMHTIFYTKTYNVKHKLNKSFSFTAIDRFESKL